MSGICWFQVFTWMLEQVPQCREMPVMMPSLPRVRVTLNPALRFDNGGFAIILSPGTPLTWDLVSKWNKQRQAHFKSERQKFTGNILTGPQRSPDCIDLGAAVVRMHLEG